MDEIKIRDLELFAYHGLLPDEKKNGQYFYLDVDLKLDFYKAAKTGDLTASVHYGQVCHFLTDFLTKHTYGLIESAAYEAAEALLLAFPNIDALTLELKKPEAPIGLPFGNVSVKVTREWTKAYLGVGANLGNKEQTILQAVEQLKQHKKIRNVKLSSLLTTKPYGGVVQEDFLNGAVELETILTPYELLDYLHELENQAGRVRTIHWGPRTLDLDILFYGECVYTDKELTIPHADMENREFVLEPLAELNPYYINPVSGQSVRMMLQKLRTHCS